MSNVLDEVIRCLREGNRRTAGGALRALLAGRRAVYRRARSLDRLGEYADGLHVALLLNLDEKEEESIEAAELAYVALSESAARHPGERYEVIRRRVFLLRRFADYLADAWVEAFMKEYREGRLLQARSVALDALARMLLADARDLERQFGKQRLDEDEELNDACNAILLPAPPSDEELTGATVMHGAFHAYLRTKYSL